MKTIGFIISIVQVVVQVAGVVRRHLEALSILEHLDRAVEIKPIHCRDVAQQVIVGTPLSY